MKKYRIGIIGIGNMGFQYFKYMLDNPRWEVISICDLHDKNLEDAKNLLPEVKTYKTPEAIYSDESIDVVGVFTFGDLRPAFIRKALAAGKHVIAEKPLGLNVEDEFKLLDEIEESGLMVAVNLFNRSAWYHKEIQEYIAKGEIGNLAIIRISHQTPGDMPLGDTLLQIEGPPFFTCGMHYIDVARWYANSEIDRWDAQGLKVWDWKDPWWVHVHGSFKNGIVFDITNGFNYGQMAQTKINNSSIEVIGTLGVVKMHHDFKKVTIEYHGVNSTVKKTGPYGGKNIDVLCDNFTKSLDEGSNIGFPTARDSVISSDFAFKMLEAATKYTSPSVGTRDEMDKIIAHKRINESPIK